MEIKSTSRKRNYSNNSKEWCAIFHYSLKISESEFFFLNSQSYMYLYNSKKLIVSACLKSEVAARWRHFCHGVNGAHLKFQDGVSHVIQCAVNCDLRPYFACFYQYGFQWIPPSAYSRFNC